MPASNETPTVMIRSSMVGLLMGTPPVAAQPLDATLPATGSLSRSVLMLMRDQDSGFQSRCEPFTACDQSAAQKSIEALVLALFAKESLREGQFEAIAEVLAGRDCVVLLPTGAGKSLAYQLAGLCMPGRTLVVDPLVALIDDQVAGLGSYGMDRAVGISAKDNRLDEAADAHFVFVTPERLQRQNFRGRTYGACSGAAGNHGGH